MEPSPALPVEHQRKGEREEVEAQSEQDARTVRDLVSIAKEYDDDVIAKEERENGSARHSAHGYERAALADGAVPLEGARGGGLTQERAECSGRMVLQSEQR